MDIMQFKYFKIIAETQSLTKAAKILHVSQPAMSAMLKKFEEELNAELFDRSANRIKLNKTGEIALLHVNTILQNAEQMITDVQNAAKQHLTLRIAFCDPGAQWFCVPRFSLAYPEINVKDQLYEGANAAELLTGRVCDIVITPKKLSLSNIQSLPFLSDQVYLSVPSDSKLAAYHSISLKDIPAQPLLYPQIGGYFLSQIEKIIAKNNLPITLVKNDLNITQHLIRTTNFLATISTLSLDLRNDGAHRTIIPMNDAELNITYYVSFLKSSRNKIKDFLNWSKEIKKSAL